MRARLRNAWENIGASLWFLPTLLVALICVLATLTLAIDERAPTLGGLRPWLFGGTAGAARDLLSAIAGSLITVVALAFSVTIVAIQQASTQFSPRVIRNFMRDHGNQMVFGAYVATFVYALLILRQVREGRDSAGDEFVPALAVTTALGLALICVALLIYFIHHTATSLQVATIADNIRRELRASIDRLYPDDFAPPLVEERAALLTLPGTPPTLTLPAPTAGFLRAIDADQLLRALPPGIALARVRPQVGDYLIEGLPLVELWATGPLEQERLVGLLEAFAIDRERSLHQDILFGIRQLVDIALKALSPGINDPTTAEHCLSHLGDVVAQLADRRFPDPWRRAPASDAILLLTRPDFPAIVEAAFGQIRREAADDVHVTRYLLGVLAQLAPRATLPERAAAIRHQADEVLEVLDRQEFTARDAATLRARAFAVLDLRAATDTHAALPCERQRGGFEG